MSYYSGTAYQPPNQPAPVPPVPPARPTVRAGTLWSGGIAAALVAAGVAVVGYLAVRGVLDIPILGINTNEATVQPSVVGYATAAAVAALVATAVLHMLLLAAPAPFTFFAWIVGLVTVTAMLLPMMFDQSLESRVATAIVNLAIGISIGALVSMSGRSAVRRFADVGELADQRI